jgi:two-component system chemotaxis response regulator CheB
VAEQGSTLRPGTVYVAPDDRHLGARNGIVVLDADEPPIGGFRPSGTHLFASVARAYGPAVIAVILTGMGADGAAGLKAVKRSGGHVIAQDEDTSVVFGMPASAIADGTVDEVAPLGEISTRVVRAAEQVTRRGIRGAVR